MIHIQPSSNNNQHSKTRRYRTAGQHFSFSITALILGIFARWVASNFYGGNIPSITAGLTFTYAVFVAYFTDVTHWYEIPLAIIFHALILVLAPIAIIIAPIGYLIYLIGKPIVKTIVAMLFVNAEFTINLILFGAFIVWLIFKLSVAVFVAAFPGTQSLPIIPQEDTITTKISEVSALAQIQISPTQDISKQVIVHPYIFNQRLFFHAVDSQSSSEIEIPQSTYTWFHERLLLNLGFNLNIDYTERLVQYGDAIREMVVNNEALLNKEPVFVADGGMPNANYQRIFRPKLVFRSSSLNKDLVTRNIQLLYHSSPIQPDNTVIINGIPGSSEELAKIKEDANKWNQWQGIRNGWQNIIRTHNFDKNSGETADDVLEALKHQSNILIIVAHSDGQTIYFPDGSELTTNKLKDIQGEIAKNKPLVALFSCETAQKNDGLASFSQTLIDLGARAVVAPTGKIGAKSTSILLDRILQKSADGRLPPIEAIWQAARETNMFDLENWIGYTINTDIQRQTGAWL